LRLCEALFSSSSLVPENEVNLFKLDQTVEAILVNTKCFIPSLELVCKFVDTFANIIDCTTFPQVDTCWQVHRNFCLTLFMFADHFVFVVENDEPASRLFRYLLAILDRCEHMETVWYALKAVGVL